MNKEFIVITLIAVGIVFGVYIVQQKTDLFPKASQPVPYEQGQTIENDTDLRNASYELDVQNIDQIDDYLRRNDADLQIF